MSATDDDDLLLPNAGDPFRWPANGSGNAGKQGRRGEDHPGVAEMIATPRGTGYTE